MYNKTDGDRKERVDNVFEQIQGEYLYPVTPSPCLNSSNEHNCQSYCQWHKTFFDSNGKKKSRISCFNETIPASKEIGNDTFY